MKHAKTIGGSPGWSEMVWMYPLGCTRFWASTVPSSMEEKCACRAIVPKVRPAVLRVLGKTHVRCIHTVERNLGSLRESETVN